MVLYFIGSATASPDAMDTGFHYRHDRLSDLAFFFLFFYCVCREWRDGAGVRVRVKVIIMIVIIRIIADVVSPLTWVMCVYVQYTNESNSREIHFPLHGPAETVFALSVAIKDALRSDKRPTNNRNMKV